MGNKNFIKRSIFKEIISELKSKKFSFEINRIELPNGHEGEYGYIKHPGAALAVPITKDNKVIILRQYRFAVSRYLLEFPAGTLEIDETPINSIKREIQEETGFSAEKWDDSTSPIVQGVKKFYISLLPSDISFSSTLNDFKEVETK